MMGAVTPGYRADRTAVVAMLNGALATEIVCILRYKSHHHSADGPFAKEIGELFLEHAEEETNHADWIAERISQLGEKPNYGPSQLSERASSQYV